MLQCEGIILFPGQWLRQWWAARLSQLNNALDQSHHKVEFGNSLSVVFLQKNTAYTSHVELLSWPANSDFLATPLTIGLDWPQVLPLFIGLGCHCILFLNSTTTNKSCNHKALPKRKWLTLMLKSGCSPHTHIHQGFLEQFWCHKCDRAFHITRWLRAHHMWCRAFADWSASGGYAVSAWCPTTGLQSTEWIGGAVGHHGSPWWALSQVDRQTCPYKHIWPHKWKLHSHDVISKFALWDRKQTLPKNCIQFKCKKANNNTSQCRRMDCNRPVRLMIWVLNLLVQKHAKLGKTFWTSVEYWSGSNWRQSARPVFGPVVTGDPPPGKCVPNAALNSWSESRPALLLLWRADRPSVPQWSVCLSTLATGTKLRAVGERNICTYSLV